MLSRRAALKGGTAVAASAVVITAARPVASALADNSDPVVALERQWKVLHEEIDRLSVWYREQYKMLPAWAQADETAGWPDISDLPAFKERMPCTVGVLGKRPSFEHLKSYNRMQFAVVAQDTPAYSKVRAQGRARVRA